MSESPEIQNIMVTGATGFVGRSVVRELLARDLGPVCLVRSRRKLAGQHPDAGPDRLIIVEGSLDDRTALRQAAELSQAAIHLVGIIMARRLKGQTFGRVHAQGTRNAVDAAGEAGIRRFVHMSALGTRPDGVSTYHRTKWAAEEYLTHSGLDWTILRPSLIHGSEGEFMRLMKRFICGLLPPVIPYFGSGQAKVQPVSVKDVAFCAVEALRRGDTIGKVYPLGGPKAYSWIELYNTCRATMPGAKRWKPLASLPVSGARLMAALTAAPMALAELVMPSIGRFRFDAGQVQMTQEDSVCDHTVAERAFDIRMRSFEDELELYAGKTDC
ncbi:MAG: NAD(P)H-binding protein [Phycisphaerales bacterium]|nr:MAG: NAD(P)H-binding protein [Phycisphaerales bacterium]